ncbi:hypothetical protein C8F01DRAFT_1351638 [Mycena amicta]|nr:hypothetical protein C8F01DRAFT_1351638 [Mycena amicta]
MDFTGFPSTRHSSHYTRARQKGRQRNANRRLEDFQQISSGPTHLTGPSTLLCLSLQLTQYESLWTSWIGCGLYAIEAGPDYFNCGQSILIDYLVPLLKFFVCILRTRHGPYSRAYHPSVSTEDLGSRQATPSDPIPPNGSYSFMRTLLALDVKVFACGFFEMRHDPHSRLRQQRPYATFGYSLSSLRPTLPSYFAFTMRSHLPVAIK